VEQFTVGRQNVRLINYTTYINGEDDFAADINHLTRRTYVEIAGHISAMLNDYFNEDVARTANVLRWLVNEINQLVGHGVRPRRKTTTGAPARF
jgi:hypothetical protein